MKTKEPKIRLALLIEPIKNPTIDSCVGTSARYSVSVCHIDPNTETPLNISRSGFQNEGAEMFADLQFISWFSWYGGKFQEGSFSAEYREVYSIDLQVLEILSKGLRTAEKIRKAFPVQPTSFGQYVALMASGFGIKELIRKHPAVEARRNNGTFYTDSTWQILPVTYAQRIVDEQIDKARKFTCPQQDSAVA